MKLAFAIMLMTTALGADSAAFAAGQGLTLLPVAGLTSGPAPDAALTLIDDDGDEGGSGWFWSPSDEDDEGDCEGDDDDEGEDCSTGAAGNAAKAGTVAPPKNGLFTNGTSPVVKSN